MSSDGFLPASAATAKSKKLARQAASRPTTSSTTAAVKAKGKGKASARGAEPHLLSTQPGQADDDFLDDEFEREPLDAGVEPKRALGGAAAAGDADAAMDEDGAGADDEDDAVMIDPSQLPTPVVRTPIAQLEASAAASSSSDPNLLSFAPVKNHGQAGLTQKRKIGIPPHRMTPLKRDWIKIYTPLVEECGLQVRMNVHKRQVEMKTSKHTPHPSSLTRAADFLSAYCMGFAVEDAIAMLRLEEIYVESFEIKDIKMLHGDHLSRAIGRLAGYEGKMRHLIENASRTRIVLADQKISILGTYGNIATARRAISNLVMGSPPGKVMGQLRTYASRSKSRM
ncbi:hypothetical protein Rhopal_005555-T1 [Rhodotorula paludigena]|uniref:Pre-rRNA-processing protein PNO1 n=1 Tax=Rhodotorula paludigena TaxID=86838 RepID=A0AAV5GIN8_9BASI|nr:hypothetical protein Rhopal_005555-T1 [Rhodotorula paludigena]